MITCAKTKHKPVNIAHYNDDQTVPILAFNREGKIEVFLFEDTILLKEKLALDNNHIPLSDWVNANILYHVSSQLCLIPGESEANDKEIMAHLQNVLSDNIINKKEVATEICDAWNRVAKKTHFDINDIKGSNKTELGYQGAYELTLRDYFAKLLSTTYEQIDAKFYLQGAELINSTFAGRAFSKNRYLQRMALVLLGEAYTKDLPSFKNTYSAIKGKIEPNNEEWFITITGMVEFEIDDLLTAKEAQSSISEIKEVLSDLLNRKIAKLSANTKIGQFLPQTIALMQSPLTHETYKKLAEKPTEEQIRQAIEYVIEKNVRQPCFVLKFSTTNSFNEILRIARSDKKQDKKELLKILLDDTQPLTPTLLNAIIKRSSAPEIQDAAANALERIAIEKLQREEKEQEEQAKREKEEQALNTQRKKNKQSKQYEQFENKIAARFGFWSTLTALFAFTLTFGAIMTSAALTATLMGKALVLATVVAGFCKMASSSVLEARKRYLRLARNTYDITKLDNIHDPAEIEALQIGVDAASNQWNYYGSYFKLRAYNYPGFLGGYVPAMEGNEELVAMIKGLKPH